MSADLAFDPATFTFAYPVWICVRRGGSEVIGGTLEGGRKFVSVFTDEDLLLRFIAAQGLSTDAEVADIPDEGSFAGLLHQLQTDGYTHVVFDDRGAGGEMRHSLLIPKLLAGMSET
jgi:hypothetical protein